MSISDFSASPSLFAPVLSPAFAHLRKALIRLRDAPPQVLLLEGGTEEERTALALWWTASLHCPEYMQGPCLRCTVCTQVQNRIHRDVLAYDGRISNKDDEENPGLVRAFTIDNIRQLKAHLRDAPHGSAKRVVMLSGLDLTRDAAANALLKVLEEPSATTLFILMAPQREQLLPTVISRSWVVTLPWPDTSAVSPECAPWEQALALCIESGKGWLEKTSVRNSLTPMLADQILLTCQKALCTLWREGSGTSPLVTALSALSLSARCKVATLTATAQEALQQNVNPARVLDWWAIRLHILRRQ